VILDYVCFRLFKVKQGQGRKHTKCNDNFDKCYKAVWTFENLITFISKYYEYTASRGFSATAEHLCCTKCISTSEIWAIRETGCDFAVFRDNVDDAFLYEIHLCSDRALLDDVVSWLEHFVFQLRHHVSDEVRVGVCKKRDGRNQRSTVVVYDLLRPQNQAEPTTKRVMHRYSTPRPVPHCRVLPPEKFNNTISILLPVSPESFITTVATVF